MNDQPDQERDQYYRSKIDESLQDWTVKCSPLELQDVRSIERRECSMFQYPGYQADQWDGHDPESGEFYHDQHQCDVDNAGQE